MVENSHWLNLGNANELRTEAIQTKDAIFVWHVLDRGRFVLRWNQKHSHGIDTRKTIFISKMRLKVHKIIFCSGKIDSYWQRDRYKWHWNFMPFDSNKSLHFYRPYSETEKENTHNTIRSVPLYHRTDNNARATYK